MATSFELVFNKFIKKLKNDDQFFSYKGLTDEEIQEMVNVHMNSLLDRSIDRIYQYGIPDINLYDKDDEKHLFNVDLIPQEISLLSEIMYLSYFEEERNKLKTFGVMFRSSELNVMFSPANDRKTFIDMLRIIEFETTNAITNYLSRDRFTWKEKSIYS